MCTGGENSLILIKLYIYIQIFYMVRLPSKKKKKKKKKKITTYRPIFFLACLTVTGNILIFFFFASETLSTCIQVCFMLIYLVVRNDLVIINMTWVGFWSKSENSEFENMKLSTFWCDHLKKKRKIKPINCNVM